MVNCNYCGEKINTIVMKCSLCKMPNCNKHRLPELHNCINKSIIRGSNYSKMKLEKWSVHHQEVSTTKFLPPEGEPARRFFSFGSSPQSSTGNRDYIISQNKDFWTTGDTFKDIILLVLAASLFAILFSNSTGGILGFDRYIDKLFIGAFTLIFGVMAFFGYNFIVTKIAEKERIDFIFLFSRRLLFINLLFVIILVFLGITPLFFIPGFYFSTSMIFNNRNKKFEDYFNLITISFSFGVSYLVSLILTFTLGLYLEVYIILEALKLIGILILNIGFISYLTLCLRTIHETWIKNNVCLYNLYCIIFLSD